MSKSIESPLLKEAVKPAEVKKDIKVLWKLQDVMYSLNINNRELSKLLHRTPSAVVKLKKHRVMPRINSAYLSSLLVALNQIRERKLSDNLV